MPVSSIAISTLLCFFDVWKNNPTHFIWTETRPDPSLDQLAYYCPFLELGIYDVYYPSDKEALGKALPPLQNKSQKHLSYRKFCFLLYLTAKNHLPLRSAAELQNDETRFPNFNVSYSYYYNPVKKNLYAVDYSKTDIRSPDPFFWSKDDTSWKGILRCPKLPAPAPTPGKICLRTQRAKLACLDTHN
jgi:hypothetical protein